MLSERGRQPRETTPEDLVEHDDDFDSDDNDVTEKKRSPLFHEIAESNLAHTALSDDFNGWGPARIRVEHPDYNADRHNRAI